MANSHMKVLRRGGGETGKMLRYLLDPRGKVPSGKQRVQYVYSTFLCEDIEGIVKEIKLSQGDKAESIHFRVSFKEGEAFRDEREFQLFISDLMSAYLPDRSYIAVCHSDTPHQHVHIVSSYRDSDGKSLHFKGKAAWKEAIRRQEAVDAVSQKYGFSTESRKPGTFRQAAKRQTLQEVRAVERGMYVWKADLMKRIDMALQKSNSFQEFIEELKRAGVSARLRGQGITYSFMDQEEKQRKARGRRLGTDYIVTPQNFHQQRQKRLQQKEKKKGFFRFGVYDMMNIMDTTEEISEGMYDDRSLNF